MVLQDIEPDVYVAFPELLSRVSILLLSGKNPRSTLTVKKEACFYFSTYRQKGLRWTAPAGSSKDAVMPPLDNNTYSLFAFACALRRGRVSTHCEKVIL